jgi:hypothetical protein
VGKQMQPGEIADIIKADKVGSDTWSAYQQHLAANNIDFAKEPPTMGGMLTMDPSSERFTGELSDKANALLRYNYRAPYVVPERV